MHVEGEAVGSRILARIRIASTAVFGSHRETYTARENLIQDVAICKNYSVFPVDIKLSAWHLLAQNKFFLADVINFDVVCLVAARPNNNVCLFNM